MKQAPRATTTASRRPRVAGTGAAAVRRRDCASPWESPPYRLLLALWLAANVSMSMHEATSAWLMASLGASAFVVALLQAPSSLPSFLLAMPSGALTDLADRRRILIAAYGLKSVVGFALGIAILAGLRLARDASRRCLRDGPDVLAPPARILGTGAGSGAAQGAAPRDRVDRRPR